jgi:predicted outer membrane repeat protein
VLRSNGAAGSGGGLQQDQPGLLAMRSTAVSSCLSLGLGGAVAVGTFVSLALNGSVFTGNVALQGGGALSCAGCQVFNATRTVRERR